MANIHNKTSENASRGQVAELNHFSFEVQKV